MGIEKNWTNPYPFLSLAKSLFFIVKPPLKMVDSIPLSHPDGFFLSGASWGSDVCNTWSIQIQEATLW